MKLESVIDEYFFRIQISFQTLEYTKNYVKIEDFKKVLSDYSVFIPEEIEALINPLCLPFMKF